jgi:hypothetical protein
MIILEILEHIEDADLEDWLTAAFIEHQHELPLNKLCSNGGYPSATQVADIWMVEITSRKGNVWSGKFNVEFSAESKNGSKSVHLADHQIREILFALNIKTAEITFKTEALDREKILDSEVVAS